MRGPLALTTGQIDSRSGPVTCVDGTIQSQDICHEVYRSGPWSIGSGSESRSNATVDPHVSEAATQLRCYWLALWLVRFEKRVAKIECLEDDVDIYKVDSSFSVIYRDNVRHTESSLALAREEADGLVEKEGESGKRAKRKSWIWVGACENGVAVIGLLDDDDQIINELLDDEDWKTLFVMDTDLDLTGNQRICIALETKFGDPCLSRWLCKPEDHEIVDHINGNIHDHRRANLNIIDQSANAQNSCRAHRNKCGYIGVRKLESGSYRTTCGVRGEYRSATTTFPTHELEKAVELYDLATLHQYGKNALINHPEKLED